MKISDNHITFTSCDDVKNITKNLLQHGLTAFDYVRVYRNNLQRIHLGNNLNWLQLFYQSFYKLENLYFEQKWEKSYSFWFSQVNLWGIYPDKEIVGIIKERLNISNGLTIAFSNHDYNEYFYLGTENDNTENLCLNSLDMITNLCFAFKDKAHSLISHCAKEKLAAPIKTEEEYNHFNSAGDLDKFNPIDIKRYYFSDNYITEREREVAYWCAQGKSSAEIGIILNLSKRTIEAHLDNIKDKLHCVKITQVIYLLTKYGIL